MEALEELAARAASGDKAAFADIYGVLMDSVYKYLFWNLGSTDDAEDLTEEVFLRCIVNIASYNPKRGAFRSWIFRIAHNILMDHHRRNKRRGDEPLKDELHNGSAGTAERVEKKERARALHKALDRLNAVQRQVITMKYFAEMNNAETAVALGKSEGAINAIQHRALHRLGNILEERGWVS
ncbi:MAG: hypothetical protein A2Y75_00670 [Candidatus Solincola sediminis]|uniref:Sigma-70 family RNA polymerase sigma factor n=1 Tax=Candidatus Solincola sediminis TaxID=1797199 RepID=A0A1F2WQB6_9ACTN|nr:MAG: hypothetical protein A2Y75_00670 [Candidatus Solincola sediminis]